MSRHLRLLYMVFAVVLFTGTLSASAAFAATPDQAAKREIITAKVAPSRVLISPDGTPHSSLRRQGAGNHETFGSQGGH